VYICAESGHLVFLPQGGNHNIPKRPNFDSSVVSPCKILSHNLRHYRGSDILKILPAGDLHVRAEKIVKIQEADQDPILNLHLTTIHKQLHIRHLLKGLNIPHESKIQLDTEIDTFQLLDFGEFLYV